MLRILGIPLLIASPFVYVQAQDIDVLGNLNWDIETSAYELNEANATFTITDDEILLRGPDTFRFFEELQGLGQTVDAIVYRITGDEIDSFITFDHEEIGFLETNDWDEFIDSDSMLEVIKENTNIANQSRASGFSDIFVDGWAENPTLDRANNVAYWAIQGHDEDNVAFINAKALKLSKDGYTAVIWVGDPLQFTSAVGTLRPILDRLDYIEGFRYADYVPGVDSVAAVGLGALAYKLVTGKAAAAAFGGGAIAAFILILKKFVFLLFVPFVMAVKWIKGKISNRK